MSRNPVADVSLQRTPDGCGVGIKIPGYGDCETQTGFGEPLYLEYRDGALTLYVWADINQDEPTHIIDLESAHEFNREDHRSGHQAER